MPRWAYAKGVRRNRRETRGRTAEAGKNKFPALRGTLIPCAALPDKWFSEDPKKVASAKADCNACPARTECAELGENEEFGVWGGMTPDERRDARHFRVIMLEELNNARILRMHGEGLSISAMARELGIPRMTLADRLRRLTGLAA